MMRVAVPTELHAQAAARARQDGKELAVVVAEALAAYLKPKPKRAKTSS